MIGLDERPVDVPVAGEAACPCQAANKRKGWVCGKPSTHDVFIHCPTCQYDAVRHLCTHHAERAKRKILGCAICRQRIIHAVVPR